MKVAGLSLQACNFIKKETLAQVFSCEFAKFLKNSFFTEHVWATASGNKHPQFSTETTSEVVLKNNRDFGTAFPVILQKFLRTTSCIEHFRWLLLSSE